MSDKFWSRVDKAPTFWLWTGSRTSAGYGNLSLGNNKYDYAHRVSYRLAKGEIPEGLVLDHLCRNRSCVNPDHLEAVLQIENVRRGAGAYGPLKKSCVHGHDMTAPENVYWTPRGARRCRLCANAKNDRRREERHARGLRWQKPKAECIRGHAFDDTNTYTAPDGKRTCRQCSALHARKYRAERKSS